MVDGEEDSMERIQEDSMGRDRLMERIQEDSMERDYSMGRDRLMGGSQDEETPFISWEILRMYYYVIGRIRMYVFSVERRQDYSVESSQGEEDTLFREIKKFIVKFRMFCCCLIISLFLAYFEIPWEQVERVIIFWTIIIAICLIIYRCIIHI